MKCIILAAGYATRLYPLTQNFPKPLLEVGNKTIVDWLIDDIKTANTVDEFIVVSNHKFVKHFNDWAKDKKNITILDDGTDSNDNRLGAVKDIEFAIERCNIDDDVMVLAGDNVLDFSMCGFIDYFNNKHKTCVMRYYEEDKAKISIRKKCLSHWGPNTSMGLSSPPGMCRSPMANRRIFRSFRHRLSVSFILLPRPHRLPVLRPPGRPQGKALPQFHRIPGTEWDHPLPE